MKSLFKGLLCASLVLAAVGCGKENKSGSNGSVPLWNMYSGLATTSLQQWYQGVESLPSSGVRQETRRIEIYNTNGGCTTKTVLGFIDISYCLSSNAIASSNNVINQIVPIAAGQPRSSVARLAEVFNPGAGMAVSNVQQISGNIYQIDVYNQSTGQSKRYKIDTNLNAAFNPVDIYDSQALRREYLVNIQ
jgi:hypothetical protein